MAQVRRLRLPKAEEGDAIRFYDFGDVSLPRQCRLGKRMGVEYFGRVGVWPYAGVLAASWTRLGGGDGAALFEGLEDGVGLGYRRFIPVCCEAEEDFGLCDCVS